MLGASALLALGGATYVATSGGTAGESASPADNTKAAPFEPGDVPSMPRPDAPVLPRAPEQSDSRRSVENALTARQEQCVGKDVLLTLDAAIENRLQLVRKAGTSQVGLEAVPQQTSGKKTVRYSAINLDPGAKLKTQGIAATMQQVRERSIHGEVSGSSSLVSERSIEMMGNYQDSGKPVPCLEMERDQELRLRIALPPEAVQWLKKFETEPVRIGKALQREIWEYGKTLTERYGDGVKKLLRDKDSIVLFDGSVSRIGTFKKVAALPTADRETCADLLLAGQFEEAARVLDRGSYSPLSKVTQEMLDDMVRLRKEALEKGSAVSDVDQVIKNRVLAEKIGENAGTEKVYQLVFDPQKTYGHTLQKLKDIFSGVGNLEKKGWAAKAILLNPEPNLERIKTSFFPSTEAEAMEDIKPAAALLKSEEDTLLLLRAIALEDLRNTMNEDMLATHAGNSKWLTIEPNGTGTFSMIVPLNREGHMSDDRLPEVNDQLALLQQFLGNIKRVTLPSGEPALFHEIAAARDASPAELASLQFTGAAKAVLPGRDPEWITLPTARNFIPGEIEFRREMEASSPVEGERLGASEKVMPGIEISDIMRPLPLAERLKNETSSERNR